MKQAAVSAVAENDLRQTWNFIAEQSVEAADRQEAEFREVFGHLAEMPMIGQRKLEWTDRPVRFWSAGSYWIVYNPETNPVQIVRVLHAARDIPQLL